jgi:hypothetical protein
MDKKNKDFFSKLWKSPLRRWWRYGRKLLGIYLVTFLIWIGLNFVSDRLLYPEGHHSFWHLIVHAFLTVGISLILTYTSHNIYLRFKSRFRPIRAFPVLYQKAKRRY